MFNYYLSLLFSWNKYVYCYNHRNTDGAYFNGRGVSIFLNLTVHPFLELAQWQCHHGDTIGVPLPPLKFETCSKQMTFATPAKHLPKDQKEKCRLAKKQKTSYWGIKRPLVCIGGPSVVATGGPSVGLDCPSVDSGDPCCKYRVTVTGRSSLHFFSGGGAFWKWKGTTSTERDLCWPFPLRWKFGWPYLEYLWQNFENLVDLFWEYIHLGGHGPKCPSPWICQCIECPSNRYRRPPYGCRSPLLGMGHCGQIQKMGGKVNITEKIYTSSQNRNHIHQTVLLL